MTGPAGRFRVLPNGGLEVVDPRPEDAALLRRLDPAFAIRESPLEGFASPRVRTAARRGVGLPLEALAGQAAECLWAIHAGQKTAIGHRAVASEASLLDLKCELAQRLLRSCQLCAHACGVDRHAAERGICGLGAEAWLAESYVHIGEEPPINPSLVLSLAGCGLRCRSCQQAALLDPSAFSAHPLADAELPAIGSARSVSFLGGNPTESLPAILRFVSKHARNWPLPLVWNSHGYDSASALTLLDGIVDCYVPDWKFGNNECAARLSGARNYVATASAAITAMCAQDVPVFVRLLILPGHIDCCHRPIVSALAQVEAPQLRVSIRGQYSPDHRIGPSDGPLCRRPTTSELAAARSIAVAAGLALIEA